MRFPESVRGRIREFKNREFVWELKQERFLKAAVSRGFHLQELPLYLLNM